MIAPLYMLDTNICSFLMRARQPAIETRLITAADSGSLIVVSAITYAELRYGATGPKASTKHVGMVSEFALPLDGILPWDAAVVDRGAELRAELRRLGTPIGDNDVAIAGHALATGATLVTNNLREFGRVPNLVVEDWTTA